jgi:hypothetical protein
MNDDDDIYNFPCSFLSLFLSFFASGNHGSLHRLPSLSLSEVEYHTTEKPVRAEEARKGGSNDTSIRPTESSPHSPLRSTSKVITIIRPENGDRRGFLSDMIHRSLIFRRRWGFDDFGGYELSSLYYVIPSVEFLSFLLGCC